MKIYTVQELINVLKIFPADTEIYSFDETNCIYGKGILLELKEDYGFKELVLEPDYYEHGYVWDENRTSWVLL